MFDIHIFTLYSLNQTILKEVKKKGKGKGHSIERIQNAVSTHFFTEYRQYHAERGEHLQYLSNIWAFRFCTCAFRSPSSS